MMSLRKAALKKQNTTRLWCRTVRVFKTFAGKKCAEIRVFTVRIVHSIQVFRLNAMNAWSFDHGHVRRAAVIAATAAATKASDAAKT